MTNQPSGSTRLPIRVMLVDDSVLVRRGIRAVLSTHESPQLKVVAEADTISAAVTECLKSKPDIVLMDIRLPDGSGLDACKQILARQPSVKILILTSFSNDNYVYEAITAGAHGYLMKEIDPLGLLQAVIDVYDGKSILDPEATARVMRLVRSQSSAVGPEVLATLSPQERRVLALVAAGKTNKEIGDQLGLSDNTVKNYLGSVFEKLQVKRRSQAAAIFVQSNSED